MQTLEANKQLTTPDGSTFVVIESGSSNDDEIIFEITMAPGAMGPPRPPHPAQDESWTVQAGELSVLVDDQWRILAAGESLAIPPGTCTRWRIDPPRPFVSTTPIARRSIFTSTSRTSTGSPERKADRADHGPHADLRLYGSRRPPPNATERYPPSGHPIRARGAGNPAATASGHDPLRRALRERRHRPRDRHRQGSHDARDRHQAGDPGRGRRGTPPGYPREEVAWPPGAGDEYIVTDGGMEGTRGFFTRDHSGSVVGIDIGGRIHTRVAR